MEKSKFLLLICNTNNRTTMSNPEKFNPSDYKKYNDLPEDKKEDFKEVGVDSFVKKEAIENIEEAYIKASEEWGEVIERKKNIEDKEGERMKALRVNNRKERDIFEKTWMEVWHIEEYDEGRPNEILEEYRQYDSFSVDHIFMEREKAIGTMRFILKNKKIELPAIKEFEIKEDPEIDAEITLLTLLKEHRHIGKFPEMMEEMLREWRKEGLRKGVIAVDERLANLYRALEMFEWEGLPKHYQGSMTVPAILTPEGVERGVKTLKQAQ